MTGKSSMFIACIYLTTLTHFDWLSGVRIASYSRQLKFIPCIYLTTLTHFNRTSGVRIDMPNEELGAILRKSHEIQVRISQAPKHMKLYSDIQPRRGRKPLLAPDPAGETRWNGCIDETIRANQIMGDLCEANNILLAPNGDDFSMVKDSERESNDLSCLTYNLEDKMILRLFEGAAAPAKYFCLLFLQDKKFTWSYVLFTI
jgi:hypothetical protein